MPTKIFFAGNVIAGDDGIGPVLYEELKSDPDLGGFELIELAVMGFDIFSYIQEGDSIIIVDAMRSDDRLGEVVLLAENQLSKDLNLASQHDFGVEEISAVIRAYEPGIKSINLLGVRVNKTEAYRHGLSRELNSKIPEIKKEVKRLVLQITERQ